jgi:FkbM family methyltransferase
VLDLGAHVGYYTVLASRLVGPSGRVYAFEPDPVSYRYLVLNVEANPCANVVTVNRAVSDRAETTSFLHDPYGAESYLTGTPVLGAIEVQTLTLDDFFSSAGWPQVDLLKMDVEGSEPKVLSGMRRLSRRNPSMLLVMELNWPAWHRAGTAREALIGVLRELAYTEGYLMEKGMHPFSVLRAFPSTRGNYNLLLEQQRPEESGPGPFG